jgi:hypothetical protein
MLNRKTIPELLHNTTLIQHPVLAVNIQKCDLHLLKKFCNILINNSIVSHLCIFGPSDPNSLSDDETNLIINKICLLIKKTSKIKYLSLRIINNKTKYFYKIFDAISLNNSISELDLHALTFYDDDICGLKKIEKIQKLNLQDILIVNSPNLIDLVNSFLHPNIKSLTLNNIHATTFENTTSNLIESQILSQLVTNVSIDELSLVLKPENTANIVEIIKKNNKITNLCLHNTSATVDINSIHRALLSNKTIVELEIIHESILNTNLETIIDIIDNNSTLQIIKLNSLVCTHSELNELINQMYIRTEGGFLRLLMGKTNATPPTIYLNIADFTDFDKEQVQNKIKELKLTKYFVY